MRKARVVVVGSGLAALFAVARLESRKGNDLSVTWVAPGAVAQLSPLVGAVVEGVLAASEAVVAPAALFPDVELLDAAVVSVDLSRRRLGIDGPGVRVGTDPSEISYDHLILAAGRRGDPQKVRGAEGVVLAAGNMDDAVVLRARLGQALQAAGAELTARRRRVLLTVAVVGSDHRAVALACAVRRALEKGARAYPRIRPEDLRVLLVSQEDDKLAGPLESAARQRLEQAGVELVVVQHVTEISPDHMLLHTVQAPERYEDVRTVLWADRSAPASFVASAEGVSVRNGAVVVDETGAVMGALDVWACGDGAAPQLESSRWVGGVRWASSSARRATDSVLQTIRSGKRPAPASSHTPWPAWDGVFWTLRDGALLRGERSWYGSLAAALLRGSLFLELPSSSARRSLCRAAWGANRSAAVLPRSLQAPPLHLTAPPPDVR